MLSKKMVSMLNNLRAFYVAYINSFMIEIYYPGLASTQKVFIRQFHTKNLFIMRNSKLTSTV